MAKNLEAINPITKRPMPLGEPIGDSGADSSSIDWTSKPTTSDGTPLAALVNSAINQQIDRDHARFFLAQVGDSVNIQSNIGPNPVLIRYLITDFRTWGKIESLGFGKLSWHADTGLPSYDVKDGSLPNVLPDKKRDEEPQASDAPGEKPVRSMLDVGDVSEEKIDEKTGMPAMRRAKCIYSLGSKSGSTVEIEWRRPSAWVEKATLTKSKLNSRSWKVSFDGNKSWKMEGAKGGSETVWKDDEGKDLAVDKVESAVPGFLGTVELCALQNLDEAILDFLVAVWVARVAVEAGVFTRENGVTEENASTVKDDQAENNDEHSSKLGGVLRTKQLSDGLHAPYGK
ncbi:hypothetical protein EJ04DRAFT_529261 [Polyplosphaeria fusca]|uniref:Uncharacterized protein n=1 Tax=Polyplosphaeria fusca TaxID=682080 RepID=A0A9P4QMR8_9PLEO|nr:hypothetical protein EJ04DRAFT_529261 [Polyplosphaeria fusca]